MFSVVDGIEFVVMFFVLRLIMKYPAQGMIFINIFFAFLMYQSGVMEDITKRTEPAQRMTQAAYSIDDYQIRENVVVAQPKSNQVLVQVYSAAINPVDYKINTAMIPFYRYWTNNEIGRDVCGKVVQVGKEVTGFEVGDFVYGFAEQGSLQEYTTASPTKISKKPKGLQCSAAASLPLVGVTGILALNGNRIEENYELLVVGASGGTGSIGVQLGKYYGARVTGICSSKNIDFVKSLGADRVIGYDSVNFEEELDQLKFDMIYDTVTSPEDENYEVKTRKLLKEGKMYVAINGGVFDWLGTILSKFVLNMNIQRSNYDLTVIRPDVSMFADLRDLTNAVDTGFVKPIIDSEYQLTYDNINEAFTKLKNRRTKGKIVFNIKSDVE